MAFKVCVALQIKSPDLQEDESLIRDALKTKPDLIELRLDYIRHVEDITEEFVKSLLTYIQPNIPVIITFRNPSEGGQMGLDEEKRIEIIKLCLKCRPKYLDIELSTDKIILGDIIQIANKNDVKLILSHHNFIKTPTFEESIGLIEKFSSNILNIERHIIKIIFTAQNFADNFIPIKLCKEMQKKNQPVISFCMGEEGIFSRISSVKFGSFFTYGSFAETTAPGQIHIEKIREVQNLLFN